MAHVYFHIDLNAFFANAECLLDPSLIGKPIAVSGKNRRSVVSTCSYEARAFGVHSGMPISEAMHLCKDLILVESHFNWYRELSRQFMAIVYSYTNIVEQASIDECYADMSEAILAFEKPLDLAVTLQQRIMKEAHLPCSIGVAPNLFLAKTASDMKKPMGITVLRLREVPMKLWPLPIKEMRGVGVKTVPVLEDLGIHTIGDLARYQDVDALRSCFGKNTEYMIRRANGEDDRKIVTDYDARSMGVSETMLEDITDFDEIRGIFRSLSRRLSLRLGKAEKAGHSISIRIRYPDFTNVDRTRHVQDAIWMSDDLFVHAMSLFQDNWDGEEVRLLGLSISDFQTEEEHIQMSIFDMKANEAQETSAVLRDLNQNLTADQRLQRASDLLKEKS